MASWTLVSFILLWNFVSIWYQVIPIVGSVENYEITWQMCRHLDNATLVNVSVISNKTVRSTLDCARRCTGVSECQMAVVNTRTMACHQLHRDNNSSGSPFSDVDTIDDACRFALVREATQEEEPDTSSSCSVITECPVGYMGQYCDIQNDETCYYPLKLINHVTYNETKTQTINGLNTLKELTSTAKIFVQVNNNSDFLVGPVDHMYITQDAVWCGQIHHHLTRESWDSYESNPKIQSYIMSHEGDWHTITMNLDYTGHQVASGTAASLQVFIRDPVNVFSPIRVNESMSGSASDVISAILSGYEPTQIVSTTYDLTTTFAMRHYLKTSMIVSGTTNNPEVPLYYLNMKVTTDPRVKTLKSSLDGQELIVTTPEVSRADWPFDPCWYEATEDSRSPDNGPSICHLKAAIRSGKRTRATFQGVSAQAVVVYALTDYVLFQPRPYMTPKVNLRLDGTVKEVHKIASTDGQVITCRNLMASSAAIDQVTEVTDDIKWFVDSRKWELIYESHLDGTFVSGSVGTLTQKLSVGADVQIVVETGEMTTSYRAVWLKIKLDGDGVAAEATGIIAIFPDDLSFVRNNWCTRRDYLFSTSRGMQYVEYTLGNSATAQRVDSHGLNGRIKWYLSEYGAD